jgi:MFS family permease
MKTFLGPQRGGKNQAGNGSTKHSSSATLPYSFAHRAVLERRAVLVGLSALVLASDVIGGIAPGIGVMLAARAVLGVGVGGSWVFGAGAAITLVSERARGTAMAVVSAGIFITTVASLPVVSLIGTLTTWRAAVAVAADFAVIAVVAQLAAGSAVGGIVYDAKGPGRRADRRRPGRADPAGPRRRGHQLSASRLRRSGPRAGPGSAGPSQGAVDGAGNSAPRTR